MDEFRNGKKGDFLYKKICLSIRGFMIKTIGLCLMSMAQKP
jgi:hypothetical protein